MASDRIFGAVLIGLALAYIASAFQIQTSFLKHLWVGVHLKQRWSQMRNVPRWDICSSPHGQE